MFLTLAYFLYIYSVHLFQFDSAFLSSRHAASNLLCSCTKSRWTLQVFRFLLFSNYFSQAIRAGNTLYVSGQLGLDPKTMNFAGPSVEEQTEQSLKNLMNIVKEAGGASTNIVKTTVLLANMEDFTKVNDIYVKCMHASFCINPNL